MALTLYIDSFSISPYAFSVYVALEEKGVPYIWKTVSLPDRAHYRSEYLGPSMTGRVPAIDHDGFWLAESAAIVNYLDEVFTAPQFRRALPEGVKERARARMVMDWIRSDLMPIREERPTHTMFYQRADKPLTRGGPGGGRAALRYGVAPGARRCHVAVRRLVAGRQRSGVHAAAARDQWARGPGQAAQVRRSAVGAPIGAKVGGARTSALRRVLNYRARPRFSNSSCPRIDADWRLSIGGRVVQSFFEASTSSRTAAADLSSIAFSSSVSSISTIFSTPLPPMTHGHAHVEILVAVLAVAVGGARAAGASGRGGRPRPSRSPPTPARSRRSCPSA